MKQVIALALAIALFFGCLGNTPGNNSANQGAPSGQNPGSGANSPPSNIAITNNPTPDGNSPKAAVAPSPNNAMVPCEGDSCVWQDILSQNNSGNLLLQCFRFNSSLEKDKCLWFVAGVTQNSTLCGMLSDAKYRPTCIMEVNGQFSCSPSGCNYCLSEQSCLEFSTCKYSEGEKPSCSQSSALFNTIAKKESPPPPKWR